MTAEREIEAISRGWIQEFESRSFPAERDEGSFVLKLDELVYQSPDIAFEIVKKIATQNLSAWASEGLGVGPLRTLMALHPGAYTRELCMLSSSSEKFRAIHQMALDGLKCGRCYGGTSRVA
jgi:hypothetical protein